MSDSSSGTERVVPVITRNTETPPLTIGARRLHYSFSVALPAVHLTFVSIVQGVVVGQLLGTLPLPSHTDSIRLGASVAFILRQHAYLAYFISGSLVLLIWKQFVQASLFYTWPLTMTQIALMLLIASAEVVAFREISHFYGWLIGVGLIGIIGGCIRLHNIPLRREWDYEYVDGKQGDNNIELYSGLLYITLGAMIFLFGAAAHYRWFALGLKPEAVEWLVLLILVGIMVSVIELDRNAIEKYIDDALGPANASDLERTRPAGIRYKKVKAHLERADESSALRQRDGPSALPGSHG